MDPFTLVTGLDVNINGVVSMLSQIGKLFSSPLMLAYLQDMNSGKMCRVEFFKPLQAQCHLVPLYWREIRFLYS